MLDNEVDKGTSPYSPFQHLVTDYSYYTPHVHVVGVLSPVTSIWPGGCVLPPISPPPPNQSL